jgi:deazaflavin-dependent oxidoreductase (nitroreductase family)
MTDTTLSVAVDQRVFRLLNRLVEPAVRAGLGNTHVGPGAFVLQTTGRRSGRPRRVPLLGKRVGDIVVVSTVRPNSQWIRNLEHRPDAHIWIGGRSRPVTATIIRTRGLTLARLRLHTAAGPCHIPTRAA